MSWRLVRLTTSPAVALMRRYSRQVPDVLEVMCRSIGVPERRIAVASEDLNDLVP